MSAVFWVSTAERPLINKNYRASKTTAAKFRGLTQELGINGHTDVARTDSSHRSGRIFFDFVR